MVLNLFRANRGVITNRRNTLKELQQYWSIEAQHSPVYSRSVEDRQLYRIAWGMSIVGSLWATLSIGRMALGIGKREE